MPQLPGCCSEGPQPRSSPPESRREAPSSPLSALWRDLDSSPAARRSYPSRNGPASARPFLLPACASSALTLCSGPAALGCVSPRLGRLLEPASTCLSPSLQMQPNCEFGIMPTAYPRQGHLSGQLQLHALLHESLTTFSRMHCIMAEEDRQHQDRCCRHTTLNI